MDKKELRPVLDRLIADWEHETVEFKAVSYTHLTLPTIYSV